MHKTVKTTVSILLVIIATLLVFNNFVKAAYAPGYTYQQRKDIAHNIAEQARTLGLPAEDPILKRASEIWWDAHTEQESVATMLAKTMYNEGRGIPSDTHKACVAWVALNRVDAGYGTLQEVLTAPNQFAYSAGTPVQQELYTLAWDVLTRWQNEKAGVENAGRVLPVDYLWFAGDGKYNYFRNSYNSNMRWDYSLESPYGT